jgi:hypothetical protein
MPSFSSVLNSLPHRIRNRFSGLPTYAKAMIEADEGGLPKGQRTSPAEMQQIQIIFQLILLDRFFQKGTEVAKMTVKELQAAGVSGFSVGATLFEGENEAVMRGANLSIRLRTMVPEIESLSQRFAGTAASQLVIPLRNLIRHG